MKKETKHPQDSILKEEKNILEIEISKETAEQIKEIIENYLWEKDEGLRRILGAGIGFLLAQKINLEKTDEKEKIRTLTRELTLSEGRLAGTRYRMAEMTFTIHRWELASGSLQSLGAATDKIVVRQNNELAEMRETIVRLNQENQDLQNALSIKSDGGSFFKRKTKSLK
jgi:hypothetical protein